MLLQWAQQIRDLNNVFKHLDHVLERRRYTRFPLVFGRFYYKPKELRSRYRRNISMVKEGI